jgi:hypothetical protein
MEVLFASLSLSGIIGIFYKILDFPAWIDSLFFVVVLSGIGYAIYSKRKQLILLFKDNRLFRSVLIISVFYIICWFYFSVRPSSVSAEDRLFMPATMLLFPFLLDFAWGIRSKAKYLYVGIIVLSAGYGILSFASRIKKYSIDGSVPSKNQQLNGFKVFAANKYPNAELDTISDLITTKLRGYYVIVLNRDIAFQLHTRNYLIVPGKSAPIKVTLSNVNELKYVVLVDVGRAVPPTGLTKIYASKMYELYKSN